ncbi:hypothetical protein F7725_008476, partial [Dissostichus mawsoni]
STEPRRCVWITSADEPQKSPPLWSIRDPPWPPSPPAAPPHSCPPTLPSAASKSPSWPSLRVFVDVWGEVGGGEEEKREDVLQELQAEDGGNGLQVELTFRQESSDLLSVQDAEQRLGGAQAATLRPSQEQQQARQRLKLQLNLRGAPQQVVPLEPQGDGAVHGDEVVPLRAEQRAQDPLLLQGPVSGPPQGLAQGLQLTPARPPGAPRHHGQHGVHFLHKLLHLLRPRLRFPQLLQQVLDEGTVGNTAIQTGGRKTNRLASRLQTTTLHHALSGMEEQDKKENGEYSGEIKGGMRPSMKLVVMGIINRKPKSMEVVLSCAPQEEDEEADVGLQLKVSFTEKAVQRNARVAGNLCVVSPTVPLPLASLTALHVSGDLQLTKVA